MERRKCLCDDSIALPAKQVKKIGKTEGLWFYGCTSFPKRCNYFEWVDVPEAPINNKKRKFEFDNKENINFDPLYFINELSALLDRLKAHYVREINSDT